MAAAASRKTLSGRLFAAFFAISLGILLLSAAAVVAASWVVYEGDAEQRLSTQAEAVASMLAQADEQTAESSITSLSLADIRVTLIAGDGRVVFDNEVDASTMPNHANRAEVVAAREAGESAVLRRSETTGSDTLYAAVVVPGGDYVIRLAETRTSLPSYLGRIAVPLAIILLLALIISAVFARIMAKKISSPIVAVDLDHPLSCDVYAEVVPLLERVEAQKVELVENNEKLLSAVEARREFTGNVSHEMKSPLQVIGGYAELIESGIVSPEDTKRFAGLISTEARAMRGLIDDVLTLSRLDEMQEDISSEVDIAAACGSAITRLASTAEAKGIDMIFEADSPAYVHGSASPAEQMIYNLVDNAIRYGHEGGKVEVVVKTDADDVTITISDDGPGVPEHLRERIFERFYRTDASRSRETGGTGLGLAIVKHTAVTMGGSIWASESAWGGLQVTIKLPYAKEINA